MIVWGCWFIAPDAFVWVVNDGCLVVVSWVFINSVGAWFLFLSF